MSRMWDSTRCLQPIYRELTPRKRRSSCPEDWERWDTDSPARLTQTRRSGYPVIAISGDGGMQMNIQEFATAVLEELPLVLCVLNNTYLGMVRQWQKLFYGKRYGMTNLKYRRTVSTDQWGGDAGVHAGFCEAGRELRGERNPCDEAGRDRTGI